VKCNQCSGSGYARRFHHLAFERGQLKAIPAAAVFRKVKTRAWRARLQPFVTFVVSFRCLEARTAYARTSADKSGLESVYTAWIGRKSALHRNAATA